MTGLAALLALAGGPPDGVELTLPGASDRVRVRAVIDGRPVSELRDRFLRRLFDHFDRDGDGRLDPAESARVPSPLVVRQWTWGYLQATRLAPPAPAGATSWDEFRQRYRRAGLGDVMITTAPCPASRTLTDALLARLDTDADGKLSAAELDAAAARLRSLDADGDELIAANELVPGLAAPYPLPTTLLAVAPPSARSAGHEFEVRFDGANVVGSGRVVLAGDAVDFRGREARLAGQFARHRQAVENLFREADVDRDGRLTPAELTTLPGPSIPALFALADPDGNGAVTAAELAALLDLQAEAVASHVQVGVLDHGRGLFEAIDTDRDGCLSVPELRAAKTRLLPDGGTLAPAALPRQWSVTVSRGQPRLPGHGAKSASPLAGPGWFQRMDANRDGVVSWAEFLGTRDQFDRLDRDRDGLLSADEGAGTR